MPPLNDPPVVPESAGQQYWRSLDHLADTPEFRAFLHREFPAGASELLDSGERRHFLKIMGASMALAGLGLSGCRRWPEEHIAPFASRPVGRDPGVPAHYATCMDLGGVARGLVVTTFDGRPIKIEGNPDHPASRGAADLFDQASVLGLYDPDRSRSPRRAGEPVTWIDFVTWAEDHFKKARNKRGAGLAVLSEASSSPSMQAMKTRFMARYPRATWHEYEPANNDQEIEGSRLAFGVPYRPQWDLEQARTIVCLDADILGGHRDAVRLIGQFARGRRPVAATMNRLYAFEADWTVTGANADHREPVRPSDVAIVAAYLAARILDDETLRRLEDEPAAARVLSPRVRADLDHAVDDLRRHRGHGVVVAGARQPAEVHLLVHLMNHALGNVGVTVGFAPLEEPTLHAASIGELAEKIGQRGVQTLLILGGNPAYDAPADVGLASLLEGVEHTIHLSEFFDETSSLCTWHVNRAHYLERWGDGRSWDGTYSVCQPLIEPLFDGRSELELLAVLAAEELTAGQSIVKRTFAEIIGAEDDARWRRTLHDGLLAGSASPPDTPTPDREALPDAARTLRGRIADAPEGWELAFAMHPTVYDGRFANNGWLQELPDPMSKLTWDNAVLISPASADELGVETGDLVEVAAGAASVVAPVMILPGQPDRTATLHLGYGRRFEGRICRDAGFDFYPLRTRDAMGFARGASLTRRRGSYPLASTQDHHTIDVNSTGGRGIQQRLPMLFREATLEEYGEHPDFAAHRTHVVHRLSLWEETNLEGGNFRWAMAVDLNACVGCGACIVACQAENNIPIVGKEQVLRGREMHWIRVDRYFKFGRDADRGDRYDPRAVADVALQPVICMQCENAPCEQVCPVAATVHDRDGLNVMVYNRCIGTRYCSNNCPYKVRRFNYFDWHRREHRRESSPLAVDSSYFDRPQATPDDLRRLQFNPEVTVRMRGVMEKCTYCVQRIDQGRIEAKNAHARLTEAEKEQRRNLRIEVPDGAITPACAETCPAEALVFGDLNDADSRVSRLHGDARAYEMLEELNVKARTRYLAKVRNPAGDAQGGAPAHG